MNLFLSKNIKSLLFGVIFVLSGINIFIKGKIWNLQLAYERYLVGGAILAVGIYIIYIVFKNNDKTS